MWMAGRFTWETNGLQFAPSRLNPAMLGNSSGIGNEADAGGAAYIETNGTLWVAERYFDHKGNLFEKGYVQAGQDTNWVDVAFDLPDLVGLKRDGSLWSWHWPSFIADTAEVIKLPPTQFSTHNDWVGILRAEGGIYTLAADGSLWLWPTSADNVLRRDAGVLIKTDKRPKLIANIFSTGEGRRAAVP